MTESRDSADAARPGLLSSPDPAWPNRAGSSPDGGSALGGAFARSGAVLVAYVMAGYPDRVGSLAALEAVAGGGAGVIELGVPYGDAVADGPVIVEAGKAALANGFGLAETIGLAGEFLGAHADAPPVALMTYLNPMMRLGFPRVAALVPSPRALFVPDLRRNAHPIVACRMRTARH